MTRVSLHRSRLPQLNGDPILTDGGIETTLIFHDGLELPHFASFMLLESTAGRAALIRYFESYVEVARKHGDGPRAREPDLARQSATGRRSSATRPSSSRSSTARRSTCSSRSATSTPATSRRS